MLKDYLSSFAPQLHGHVELRAQISTSHAVAMLNGDLQSNARAQQGGVSARVYRNGVYGFASAVEYDEESVRRVLKAAAFPGCPREEEPSRAAGAAQRHGGEG